MIGRAAGTTPGRPPWAARLRGLSAREKWGYGFWLFLGLVFGIPESWAGLATPPWPALSETVGHLEALWPPTAVIVVALIVAVAFYAVRYPPAQAGEPGARWPPAVARRRGQGRTYNGRLSQNPGAASPVPVLVYIPLALAAMAAGSLIAATASGDRFVLGYVIYGLFAVFGVVIPNALAYFLAREVPFPTLLRTVTDLERRSRLAAVVILAGLVILLLHLVFYPWPDHLG